MMKIIFVDWIQLVVNLELGREIMKMFKQRQYNLLRKEGKDYIKVKNFFKTYEDIEIIYYNKDMVGAWINIKIPIIFIKQKKQILKELEKNVINKFGLDKNSKFEHIIKKGVEDYGPLNFYGTISVRLCQ